MTWPDAYDFSVADHADARSTDMGWFTQELWVKSKDAPNDEVAIAISGSLDAWVTGL